MCVPSEPRIQAHGDAACRRNRITGKQASEVEDVEAIIKTVPIHLKAHVHSFALIDIRTLYAPAIWSIRTNYESIWIRGQESLGSMSGVSLLR